MKSLSVAPLGVQTPRVRHAPSVRANAWEDVVDVAKAYGLVLDEWQENVLEAAMGERTDGTWATPRVGVSVPRQNGKGALIEARELAGLLVFGEQTIVHSAHQQQTARVGFERIRAYFDNYDDLRRKVKSITAALNREVIELTTGQKLRFPARSKSTIRGFSIDLLILDEAQIFGDSALQSVMPTMSARPNPQMWLLGTPPTPADDGEVFSRFREGGIEGRDRRLCWCEWSAASDASVSDPQAWAEANPALGNRISYESVSDELAALDDEGFARERLGIWDTKSVVRVIDDATWATQADRASLPIERITLALDVAPDRSVAAVSLAGRRADGSWHAELYEHRKGADWVAGWVKQKAESNELHAVVVDEIAGMTEKRRNGRHYLKGSDVEVTLMGAEGRDAAMAWAAFHDGVTSGTVWHTDQPQVNVALAQAGTRDVGGGKALSKKHSAADITPITSETFALWGAQRDDVKRPVRRRSGAGNSGRRVVAY